ncbi:MAG: site-specific integrase [Planctomycetota bacterium]|nr:site-specific integrase [Planctomycetota bacterium]
MASWVVRLIRRVTRLSDFGRLLSVPLLQQPSKQGIRTPLPSPCRFGCRFPEADRELVLPDLLGWFLAAFTGLRKSELASIRIGDVHLDTMPAYLELHAENEKAKRGAKLPLKNELADMVRKYIAGQRQVVGNSVRLLLPDVPLIEPPTLKTFNLDLAVAGIEKVDSCGRSMDIHSLRHTFGTMLARSGVAPRTAQELMRHSDIRLTTNIYQHLELVDTAGAVEMLPDLEECRSSAVAISSTA